jgi:hypothetical protein
MAALAWCKLPGSRNPRSVVFAVHEYNGWSNEDNALSASWDKEPWNWRTCTVSALCTRGLHLARILVDEPIGRGVFGSGLLAFSVRRPLQRPVGVVTGHNGGRDVTLRGGLAAFPSLEHHIIGCGLGEDHFNHGDGSAGLAESGRLSWVGDSTGRVAFGWYGTRISGLGLVGAGHHNAMQELGFNWGNVCLTLGKKGLTR